MDVLVDDIVQNQVCPDDTTYHSCFDKTTFETNTTADESFPAIHNQALLDSIAWGSYFDGGLAINNVADDTIASNTFDIIPNQFCPCDSLLDEPMTLNTTHIQVGSDLISNSNDDGSLTLNLATSTADDTFDIRNPMMCDPNLDEPTTKEFQKWKDRWDEKMLLVRWRREGKDLDDITEAFKNAKGRGRGGWKSMRQRADREVCLALFVVLNATANFETRSRPWARQLKLTERVKPIV